MACVMFDLRLRKHLSLAEESCWQRCADKLIATLPGITKVRRPFIALILPEKPEILVVLLTPAVLPVRRVSHGGSFYCI